MVGTLPIAPEGDTGWIMLAVGILISGSLIPAAFAPNLYVTNPATSFQALVLSTSTYAFAQGNLLAGVLLSLAKKILKRFWSLIIIALIFNLIVMLNESDHAMLKGTDWFGTRFGLPAWRKVAIPVSRFSQVNYDIGICWFDLSVMYRNVLIRDGVNILVDCEDQDWQLVVNKTMDVVGNTLVMPLLFAQNDGNEAFVIEPIVQSVGEWIGAFEPSFRCSCEELDFAYSLVFQSVQNQHLYKLIDKGINTVAYYPLNITVGALETAFGVGATTYDCNELPDELNCSLVRPPNFKPMMYNFNEFGDETAAYIQDELDLLVDTFIDDSWYTGSVFQVEKLIASPISIGSTAGFGVVDLLVHVDLIFDGDVLYLKHTPLHDITGHAETFCDGIEEFWDAFGDSYTTNIGIIIGETVKILVYVIDEIKNFMLALFHQAWEPTSVTDYFVNFEESRFNTTYQKIKLALFTISDSIDDKTGDIIEQFIGLIEDFASLIFKIIKFLASNPNPTQSQTNTFVLSLETPINALLKKVHGVTAAIANWIGQFDETNDCSMTNLNILPITTFNSQGSFLCQSGHVIETFGAGIRSGGVALTSTMFNIYADIAAGSSPSGLAPYMTAFKNWVNGELTIIYRNTLSSISRMFASFFGNTTCPCASGSNTCSDEEDDTTFWIGIKDHSLKNNAASVINATLDFGLGLGFYNFRDTINIIDGIVVAIENGDSGSAFAPTLCRIIQMLIDNGGRLFYIPKALCDLLDCLIGRTGGSSTDHVNIFTGVVWQLIFNPDPTVPSIRNKICTVINFFIEAMKFFAGLFTQGLSYILNQAAAGAKSMINTVINWINNTIVDGINDFIEDLEDFINDIINTVDSVCPGNCIDNVNLHGIPSIPNLKRSLTISEIDSNYTRNACQNYYNVAANESVDPYIRWMYAEKYVTCGYSAATTLALNSFIYGNYTEQWMKPTTFMSFDTFMLSMLQTGINVYHPLSNEINCYTQDFESQLMFNQTDMGPQCMNWTEYYASQNLNSSWIYDTGLMLENIRLNQPLANTTDIGFLGIMAQLWNGFSTVYHTVFTPQGNLTFSLYDSLFLTQDAFANALTNTTAKRFYEERLQPAFNESFDLEDPKIFGFNVTSKWDQTSAWISHTFATKRAQIAKFLAPKSPRAVQNRAVLYKISTVVNSIWKEYSYIFGLWQDENAMNNYLENDRNLPMLFTVARTDLSKVETLEDFVVQWNGATELGKKKLMASMEAQINGKRYENPFANQTQICGIPNPISGESDCLDCALLLAALDELVARTSECVEISLRNLNLLNDEFFEPFVAEVENYNPYGLIENETNGLFGEWLAQTQGVNVSSVIHAYAEGIESIKSITLPAQNDEEFSPIIVPTNAIANFLDDYMVKPIVKKVTGLSFSSSNIAGGIKKFFVTTTVAASGTLYKFLDMYVSVSPTMNCAKLAQRGIGVGNLLLTSAIVLVGIILILAIAGRINYMLLLMCGSLFPLMPFIVLSVNYGITPFALPALPFCLMDDIHAIVKLGDRDCIKWENALPGITQTQCPNATDNYLRDFTDCSASPYYFHNPWRVLFYSLQITWPEALEFLKTNDYFLLQKFREIDGMEVMMSFPFQPGEEPDVYTSCFILRIHNFYTLIIYFSILSAVGIVVATSAAMTLAYLGGAINMLGLMVVACSGVIVGVNSFGLHKTYRRAEDYINQNLKYAPSRSVVSSERVGYGKMSPASSKKPSLFGEEKPTPQAGLSSAKKTLIRTFINGHIRTKKE